MEDTNTDLTKTPKKDDLKAKLSAVSDWSTFIKFLETPIGEKLVDKFSDTIFPPNWLRLTLAIGKYFTFGLLLWFIYFLVTKGILDKITFSLILGAVIGHLMTKYFSDR
jgi:hypothetical protein